MQEIQQEFKTLEAIDLSLLLGIQKRLTDPVQKALKRRAQQVERIRLLCEEFLSDQNKNLNMELLKKLNQEALNRQRSMNQALKKLSDNAKGDMSQCASQGIVKNAPYRPRKRNRRISV